MLSFIHTADIHLGARLLKLGDKVDQQRVQIQLTFEKVVREAIDRNVPLVLIAGDLFDDQKPEKQLVEFAITNLITLNDRHIHVCISLGTHDYDVANLFDDVADMSQFPFIHVFDHPEYNKLELEDIQTVIFCNAPVANRTGESPLKGIVRDDNFMYNVALAHGSFQIPGKSSSNDSPITAEEIESTGMDYIALGHWHNQQRVGNGKVNAWYSGAPEMIDLDQTNSGKIIVGSISESREVNIESVQVGKRYFDKLSIDASTIKSQEDLIGRIREGANPDLVRLIQIDGMLLDPAFVNEEEIRRRLKSELFAIIIKNSSQISIPDVDKQVEGNILKTKFIEYVRQSGKNEDIVNEAIQMGLSLIDGNIKI